jgi:lipoic acid synthetase
MSDQPKSGEKFRTPLGFSAIKNGIKRVPDATRTGQRKPPWLRARLGSGKNYDAVKRTVHEHRLSTVCEESHCPNIGECWNSGTATIMLMGAVCTRACRFCAVDTGNPNGWLDADEPANAAEAVRLMALRYVVLTSVDRDDLRDGGANHYAACVRAIKAMNPTTAIEALTPDFNGSTAAVETVVDSGLQVFAQNVETVERLTHPVRDPRAGYAQTLGVLEHAKRHRSDVLTKTSLMLGLGETDDEIARTMDDLRTRGVDILTLGQYLQPTLNHLGIARWVHPDEFAQYRQWGLERGFIEVASGPLVRSSYRADRILEKNNLGLGLPDAATIPVKMV